MIFIIDSNIEMANCVAKACGDCEVKIFHNAIEAMQALDDCLPSLVFMDIDLTGPNGFSFLNEVISYTDTSKVPAVIISALDLSEFDLSVYGVVGFLNKDTMKPEDIKKYVAKYTR